jgi:hypothetical protein
MTAIMLKDAPGGAQLIEALTAAAKGLAGQREHARRHRARTP